MSTTPITQDTETPKTAETISAVKQRASDDVDARREQLIALSHTIHANPELSWEEHDAAAHVARTMTEAGFDV